MSFVIVSWGEEEVKREQQEGRWGRGDLIPVLVYVYKKTVHEW